MRREHTRTITAGRLCLAVACSVGLAWPVASTLSDALAASGDGGTKSSTSADETAAVATDTWRPAPLDPESLDAIVRGNIFNPAQRRRKPEPQAEKPAAEPAETSKEPEETGPPPEPPNPDNGLLLIGISIHDGQPCAFIEDRDTGKVRRVREPGEIGRGRITAIDLDGVSYQVQGSEQRIKPGRTLAGHLPGSDADTAPTASGDDSSGSAVSSSTGSGSADETADEGESSQAEILRRMRERRAEERSD